MADENHSLNSTGIKSKTHYTNFNRFSTHGGNNIVMESITQIKHCARMNETGMFLYLLSVLRVLFIPSIVLVLLF